MRWLIAPDSFKGSLSAPEAADALAAAVLRCDPSAVIDILPVADGGEGTAEVLLSLAGAHAFSTDVRNQQGAVVQARWGLLADGTRAVCDAASCLGLHLVPAAQRDPAQLSSAGLGDLLLAMADAVPSTVYVGLGGSGTNDCGYGMAAALGYRFFDATDAQLSEHPDQECDVPCLLSRVARIETPQQPHALQSARIVGLCDVRSPLLGPSGSTATFGPQKGIAQERFGDFEDAFAHFSRIVRRDVRDIDPSIQGGGAAGGLGFALAAFLDAELVRGIEAVLDAADFDRRCESADVVLCGEGRLDEQTAYGKSGVGVAARANRAEKPLFVFAGSVRGPRNSIAEMLGAREVVRITPEEQDEEDALENARENLETAAFRTLSAFLEERFP
ncbi:MAG: glycerate kinase [Ignavibacteria bacterium]|nr:glycerate kinase [Ignavibacteria bacterium]